MTGRLLIFAFAAVTACGCSSAVDPPAHRTDAIIGGSADSDDTGVVALSRVSNPYSLCSGALIAPNLVVTARHCVAPAPKAIDCSTSEFGATATAHDVVITTDATIGSTTPWYRSKEVRTPSATSVCGNDIALVILSSQLPRGIGIPLIPRIDVAPTRGEFDSVAGYGVAAPNDIGSAGVRRRRDGVQVLCRGGACGLDVASSEFGQGEGTCSGDSGGPAIDTQGRVIGITARGDDQCTVGIDTDLVSWADWIRSAATDAATGAGAKPPYWAVTGSSDVPLDAGSGGSSADVDAGPVETTSRDSGVAPAPLPTGTLDRPCNGSGDCQSNEACYSKDNLPPGICVAKCTATSDCASGLACDSALRVCLRSSTDVKSTCSVAASRPAAPVRAPIAISLIAFAVAALRRRSQG